jgi:hypothetical protein
MVGVPGVETAGYPVGIAISASLLHNGGQHPWPVGSVTAADHSSPYRVSSTRVSESVRSLDLVAVRA